MKDTSLAHDADSVLRPSVPVAKVSEIAADQLGRELVAAALPEPKDTGRFGLVVSCKLQVMAIDDGLLNDRVNEIS